MNNSLFYLFVLPIIFLYGYFFSRLYEYVYDYDKIYDKCTQYPYEYCNDGDTSCEQKRKLRDDCNNQRDKEIKDFNDKKFVTMLIIGFAGILLGAIVHLKYYELNNYINPATGIAYGGLLTVFYYLVINWARLGKLPQLLAIGFLFFGFIGGAYVFSK